MESTKYDTETLKNFCKPKAGQPARLVVKAIALSNRKYKNINLPVKGNRLTITVNKH